MPYSAGSSLLDAQRIIDCAQVEPKMCVMDIHPSKTGHLIFPLAHTVGREGRVYGVDIRDSVVKMLEGHRQLHGLDRVHLIHGDITKEVGIGDGEVQIAFLLDKMRHSLITAGFFKELRRLLAPKGKIVVVDWLPESIHPVAPPFECRVKARDCDLNFLANGFALVDVFHPSGWHWGRIYQVR